VQGTQVQDGPHPQTPSPQAHAPGAQAHPAQQLSFSFFFSIIVSPFERMARSSINADGPECQILQLARGILPRQNTERKKQEGSVENSATPVEMPTAPSRVSCINHDLRGITSFRFSHIAGGSLFASFLALRMHLDKLRRTTMPSQTKNPETPSQEDSPVSTSKETKLGRLASQAASRAKKREQRYDQEHEIFTN
jgi:hypothetical protein